ncbi:MAG: undecaprenyldiphospho-muramoylpentapeptide beta-N-acetylglucosaminyltransferase [Clostridiales bacterium]|nr:undecaprenyldiphospho-muramoylpentapeptide beta-N-acetylglucosaminyltransferase [Clostridiales bacterium]
MTKAATHPSRLIVLTGGGTAGHVTPHVSLIPKLKANGYDIHYIGTQSGIERGMIATIPGVVYHAVQSGKLRRYFSIQNFTDPFRVIWGAFQSIRLMRKLRPDVCFSKGGFVSVPVVFGAWLCHVPAVCHESDLTPGLANRICARFARRVATTFPECAEALGPKAVMTGTPLRPEIFTGSRASGLALAGFTGAKPVLLMTGGSLGAQSINQCLRKILPSLLPHMDVLHLCGKGNLDPSLENTPGYCQKEFLLAELPDALAAADIVLSRAGSNTLCELVALQKPMLLIPYPKGASRGDQIQNAWSYERQGLAQVLPQENMTPSSLQEALMHLLKTKDSLLAALREYPARDGTQAVLVLIEEVQKKR